MKTRKRQRDKKQVDLLETDMIRQASPHLSMLETERQTDCIHDSSMHRTNAAGAMQHDTTLSLIQLFYTYQYLKTN